MLRLEVFREFFLCAIEMANMQYIYCSLGRACSGAVANLLKYVMGFSTRVTVENRLFFLTTEFAYFVRIRSQLYRDDAQKILFPNSQPFWSTVAFNLPEKAKKDEKTLF